jgi:outer membrane scaffolding protein for murein synthesis (MipA/OmpV family)
MKRIVALLLMSLSLMLAPLALCAATIHTKNSAGNDVTIETSSTGITVQDRYYQDQDKQTMAGPQIAAAAVHAVKDQQMRRAPSAR